MATENKGSGYDKSIGTEQRSAVAATKLWAIILGIVLLVGIGLLIMFFNSGAGSRNSSGGAANSTSPGP